MSGDIWYLFELSLTKGRNSNQGRKYRYLPQNSSVVGVGFRHGLVQKLMTVEHSLASLGLRVAAMVAGSPPSSNSTTLEAGAALESWEDKGGVPKVLRHPVQRRAGKSPSRGLLCIPLFLQGSRLCLKVNSK